MFIVKNILSRYFLSITLPCLKYDKKDNLKEIVNCYYDFTFIGFLSKSYFEYWTFTHVRKFFAFRVLYRSCQRVETAQRVHRENFYSQLAGQNKTVHTNERIQNQHWRLQGAEKNLFGASCFLCVAQIYGKILMEKSTVIYHQSLYLSLCTTCSLIIYVGRYN